MMYIGYVPRAEKGEGILSNDYVTDYRIVPYSYINSE